MAKISAKPVRGTRDILPEEMAVRERLERTISDIYASHGFTRVETPVLENIDLLLGSEGGENLKMLFTVLKRGSKFKPTEESGVNDLCDIGLRYDLTLPLSRFYAGHAETLDMPFKALQIGNVFRAERPQKGRFRSFKQCDIDIIGEPSVSAEIELIYTTSAALTAIGFKDFTVHINDRRLLSDFILSHGFTAEDIGVVCIALDKADKIGADGVKAELNARGYDEEKVTRLVDGVDAVTLESLDALKDSEAAADLINVINTSKTLAKGRYNIEFDFHLIRGMGYYTGQVFEITLDGVGYSVAGGGRYDNMIGKYTKTSVPAVGFSIGFERIVGLIMDGLVSPSEAQVKKAALFYEVDADMAEVIAASEKLIADGFQVNIIKAKKKIGKQINQCEKTGYAGFMVFGRDEQVKLFA